jgi:Lrp/AsnC family leucine-responsive transcriptional regulator
LDSDSLLDSVNCQILAELQQNARLSYSELGRRVGLTPPAVAERIHRMEEVGIIEGYRAVVNLERIGLPLLALIRIACSERNCHDFGVLPKDIPEILECCRVTGGDSFIAKVAVTSVQHLESLIDRLMPYGETVTALVLSSPVTHRVVLPPGRTSEGIELPDLGEQSGVR